MRMLRRRVASAAAVLGLSAATLATGAPQSTADDSEYSAVIRVVEPDQDSVALPPLPGDIGQVPAEPYDEIRIGAGDLPHEGDIGTSAILYPRANFGTCYQYPGERTSVSRFSECNDTTVEIILLRGNPPVPVGIATARIQNITDGYLDTRRTHRQSTVTEISSTGGIVDFGLRLTYIQRPTFGLNTNQCGAAVTFNRTRDEWTVRGDANADFTSQTWQSHGTDQISHCSYAIQLSAVVYSGGTATPSNTIEVLPGLAICDSATYIWWGGTNHRSGCRLDVGATFEISKSDPLVDESAVHIESALNDPDKDIPDVLTRLKHDGTRVTRNNTIAKAYCLQHEGPLPAGKNCDEYPFKSTYEGAALGDGNFSARYIDGLDNQRAGSNLGRFMNYARVLDSQGLGMHEFRVDVVP